MCFLNAKLYFYKLKFQIICFTIQRSKWGHKRFYPSKVESHAARVVNHCQRPLQFRWKTFVHIWPLIFLTGKDLTARKSQPQLLKNTTVPVLIQYVKLPRNDVSANSNVFVHKKISLFAQESRPATVSLSIIFLLIISVWKLGNFCGFLGTTLLFGLLSSRASFQGFSPAYHNCTASTLVSHANHLLLNISVLC